MQQQQIAEFLKCKKDPVYFIQNYCYIEHGTKGLIPFEMFEFQKEVAYRFKNQRFNIVNKSRQTGISTITASFALWKALFHRRQKILIISIKDQDAMGFLDKVRVAYHNLPAWLKGKTVTDNAHELELDTGSVIRSVASGKSAARGQALSLLIVDECAFIRDIDEIWKSAYPTLSTGGTAILISTPNGISNFFAKTWQEAQETTLPEERNDFTYTFVHWSEVPEYGCGYPKDKLKETPQLSPWYKKMRPQFDDKQWAQEYEGDFLGSGDTVVSGKRLKELEFSVEPPIRKEYNERLWIWKEPQKDHLYIMGVDSGMGGENGDYSTFQILDITTGEQVAEFMGRLTVIAFAEIAYKIGTYYNNAYMIVENNGIGLSTTIQLARVLGYWNIYQTENLQTAKLKKNTYGFSMNNRTRALIVASIQTFCYSDAWRMYSKRLWEQLTSFIWTADNKAEHDKGKYDDLVIALGLAVYNVDAYIRSMPVEMVNENLMNAVTAPTEEVKINEQGVPVVEVEAPPPDAKLFGSSTKSEDDDFNWLK